MKGFLFTILLLPLVGTSQIVERPILDEGTQIDTAYVLQGSRNMRKLGRTTNPRPSDLRIGLQGPARTVIPVLETPEILPKPRFGYGSDWQEKSPPTDSSSNPLTPATTVVPLGAAIGPVRTRSTYSFGRYWYPAWSIYPTAPWRCGPLFHRRFSFSFRW